MAEWNSIPGWLRLSLRLAIHASAHTGTPHGDARCHRHPLLPPRRWRQMRQLTTEAEVLAADGAAPAAEAALVAVAALDPKTTGDWALTSSHCGNTHCTEHCGGILAQGSGLTIRISAVTRLLTTCCVFAPHIIHTCCLFAPHII